MDNPALLAFLTNGYSFRNLVGIIKAEAPLNFTGLITPSSISIAFENKNKRCIHDITLRTRDFSAFRYDIRDDQGNPLEKYAITLNASEFYSTTKSIGKQDGIRFYLMPGDTNLSIQPIKASNRDPGKAGALFCNILSMEFFKFTFGNYPSEPNVKMAAREFVEICSLVSSSKSVSLCITGHTWGITFKGIRANKTLAFAMQFPDQNYVSPISQIATNIEDVDQIIDKLASAPKNTSTSISPSRPISTNLYIVDDDNVLITCNIPTSTVKALSKIHNVCPKEALIKFTYVPDEPIKMETTTGLYGDYCIYMKADQ